MAQRRMFSKIITNSDPFLEMPDSAQNLYFHLGINADDDGFVQSKAIMRQIGSSEDDLKILIAKGFLIRFADGVIVITAWKINNEIRQDRYKPTYYKEHLKRLQLAENNCYLIKDNNLVLPNDNQMDTQVRLGKDRLGEVSISCSSKMNDTDFISFWRAYPKHTGKKVALAKFLKLDKTLLHTILAAIETQKKTEQWQNEKYIPHPATWLNQGRWEDEIKEESMEQAAKRMTFFQFKDKYGTEAALPFMHLWPDL